MSSTPRADTMEDLSPSDDDMKEVALSDYIVELETHSKTLEEADLSSVHSKLTRMSIFLFSILLPLQDKMSGQLSHQWMLLQACQEGQGLVETLFCRLKNENMDVITVISSS